MSGVLFGTRLLRVVPLDDGEIPNDPQWVSIKTPQQANVTAVVSQGQTHELRGGDSLISVIQEDDEYIGVDIQFTNATLSGEILEVITGGQFEDDEWTLPEMGKPRAHFAAELYVAEYGEGSQHQSDIIGWFRFFFPNVSGSLPQLNAQDRQFLAPQFTLRCRDNNKAGLRFMSYKKVETLPNDGGE